MPLSKIYRKLREIDEAIADEKGDSDPQGRAALKMLKMLGKGK